MSRAVKTNDLITRPPFQDLFPIHDEDFDAICASMKKHGYDPERPIVVWKQSTGEMVVVDGHTRFEVAKLLGLKKIYATLRTFKSQEAAFEYAVAEQRDRRNMTREDQAAHVMRVVEAFDELRQGKRTDLSNEKVGAERTAELAGTTKRNVERARRIMRSDDPEIKEAVREGKMTLSQAEKRLAPVIKLSEMRTKRIEGRFEVTPVGREEVEDDQDYAELAPPTPDELAPPQKKIRAQALKGSDKVLCPTCHQYIELEKLPDYLK
jgi:ParB-like chromosome segregation protein Spo0J